MEDGKPVLGVCRGLQLINLAAGGTLYQDLREQYAGSIKHDYFPFDGQFTRDFLSHEVRIEEHSRLGEILGVRALKVNSMHHQGIKELGAGLVASAFASDGLIEAAETTGDHFLIAVQWHPEALAEIDHRMRRLFASFVDASGDFRSSRLMSESLY
jgi:putative glutamine amidotransferase